MSYIGNQPFNTAFVTDTFTGNGSQTVFTMSRSAPNTNSILVAVSGVLQDPREYGVNGATLTFTQAPVAGTNNISVRFLSLPASNVVSTAYRSVTDATASAGQTTFPVSSYTVGFVDVYRNGVKLGAADFTATNGATVVLTVAANAGDLVQAISFLVSSVANAIPATAGIISNSYLGVGSVGVTQLDPTGTGTGAFSIPGGTTAQRPVGAATGSIRYNTSLAQNETSVLGFWFPTEQDGYTTVLGKTRTVFQFTGANQTFTVPGGITHIFVKMWGAGGGGGSYGGWRQGSTGGGGGYSEGIVPVVPGQTLTIRVGGRGTARPAANVAWPNGGGASLSGGDNQYTANGGASSSLIVPTINSGNPCMFAGGGGGGGSVTGFARNPGGAGGGLQGEDGYVDVGTPSTVYTPFTLVGKGGSQSAGGGAGAGSSTTGGAGSSNQGGTHQNANTYGGGGGGGFFGGGSGAYGTGNSMGGGGGGSGFIHSSLIRAQTLTGVREYPPCASDPDCIEASFGTSTRIGVGGDEASSGGHGLVVFYY
jgi:hypothetical protein